MFAHYRPTACSAQDTTTMLCAASILVPHHAAPAHGHPVQCSRHICWAPLSPSCSRLHDFSKWHRETFFADWIGLTQFQSRTFFKFGNSRGWYFKDYFSKKLMSSQKWTNLCLSSLYNNLRENVNLTPLTSSNRSVQWGPANSSLVPSVLFLSSPIACVACERTELLRTEITLRRRRRRRPSKLF